MSIDGRQTALLINVQSQLNSNSGFQINSQASEFQGSWTPSTYTQGSITQTTVLYDLTRAIPNFYNLAVATTLSVEVYRNLLTIGRPGYTNTDKINCPALGNSRPDSYKTSYPGFGTWDTKTVDSFYNVGTSSTLNLVSPDYPPKNYPLSGQYSYIYNNWGSKTAGPFSYAYQWNHPYAWITGWPAKSSYQATDDNYGAAYFPRPDIRVRDINLIEYDDYFKNGFIATIARQAYYEFWSDFSTRRANQYLEFVKSIINNYQWRGQANTNIAGVVNSKTHLRGTYSNINDLTTSDISGVSLSFKLFGNDLIRLGKSLDLSNIHQFGLPSKFIHTLYKNNAITDGLKLAFLYANLSSTEITQILNIAYTPTKEQEKKIYTALDLVRGKDLQDIKIILNCTTPDLLRLTDLINPIKMFPTSYRTLTIPSFSVTNSTSKVYDFIYLTNGVNSRIENWGDYLTDILPSDLTVAAGAFMMTMNQIKNIRNMKCESFAQTVSNLEVTNKGLNLINATSNGVAVDISSANTLLERIALGSGNNGSYRFCDFLGAMSGYPYIDQYKQIETLIKKVQTTNLQNVYAKLYQKSLGNNWALVSRGKGWSDPNLNPSPSWASEYVYDIFVTQETHNSGTSTVTGQGNLTSIYTATTQIAFVSNPGGGDIYTVLSSSFDGVKTTITLTTNLTTTVPKNTRLYIFENTYSGYPSGPVQDLIDAANLEIYRISTTSLTASDVQNLNYYYTNIGNQMFIEQRAIPYSIPTNENIYVSVDKKDFEIFCQNIGIYALDTGYGEIAKILEAISNIGNIGGQSLVAALREARNAQRIINTGGDVDNKISPVLSTGCASGFANISAGVVSSIVITSGGYGYDPINPPKVIIGPQGGVFGGTGIGATAVAVVNPNTTAIESINIINSGSGYTSVPLVKIECPSGPTRLGSASTPGSFAGSAFTGQIPVPDNLVTGEDESLGVDEAIEDVTICNCDCWL